VTVSTCYLVGWNEPKKKKEMDADDRHGQPVGSAYILTTWLEWFRASLNSLSLKKKHWAFRLAGILGFLFFCIGALN
jgi:hypothetical protein